MTCAVELMAALEREQDANRVLRAERCEVERRNRDLEAENLRLRTRLDGTEQELQKYREFAAVLAEEERQLKGD